MKPILLLRLFVYWALNRNCDAEWTKFASTDAYSNTQMVTELKDFFPTQTIPKDRKVSDSGVRTECAFACARNESCLAFNFLQTDEFYTCELLPDNFCTNQTRKTLVHRNGSSVWEKLTGSESHSCLDQKYRQGSIPCAFLQPGCFGTWPNCYNCFNSCIDCLARGGFQGQYQCTFWPEKNVPVFGSCSLRSTFVFLYVIDMNNKRVERDYRMSFSDIYRLYKLQVYPKLQLNFGTTDDSWYSGSYMNWIIDENGTLAGNLTFVHDWGISNDVFNAISRPVDKMPFVQVEDDRYGCGSFWLLDKDNTTYCPGGKTSMFGRLIKDSAGQIQSTGIKVANASPNKIFRFASLELVL